MKTVRRLLMCAGVAVEERDMLAYLTILGASIAGYLGAQPWAIAVAAISLSSLSYLSHRALYERAQDFSLSAVLDEVLLRSVFHAVVAAGGAYGLGWILRIFGVTA